MMYHFARALILFGVVLATTSKDSWLLRGGWKREEEEPDKRKLLWVRLVGVLVILVGVALNWLNAERSGLY